MFHRAVLLMHMVMVSPCPWQHIHIHHIHPNHHGGDAKQSPTPHLLRQLPNSGVDSVVAAAVQHADNSVLRNIL